MSGIADTLSCLEHSEWKVEVRAGELCEVYGIAQMVAALSQLRSDQLCTRDINNH